MENEKVVHGDGIVLTEDEIEDFLGIIPKLEMEFQQSTNVVGKRSATISEMNSILENKLNEKLDSQTMGTENFENGVKRLFETSTSVDDNNRKVKLG